MSQEKDDTRYPSRWRKGTSGNPAGRPRGARNKATMEAQALLEGEVGPLTRKAIGAALEGDVAALRLCLQRISPAPRARPINLDLPPIESPEDLVLAYRIMVEATCDGTITPEEAESLANVLESQLRVFEAVDLEKRVARVEQQLGLEPEPAPGPEVVR